MRALPAVGSIFRNPWHASAPSQFAAGEDFAQWRERFLVRILQMAFWLGLAVAVPSVAAAVHVGMWHVVAVDAASLALVFALSRAGRWPFDSRALTLAGLSYGLGLFFLVQSEAVGLVYMVACPVLVALLLGLRPAVLALALNAVSLLSVGYLSNAALGLPGLEQMPLLRWLVIMLNFTLVGGVITLATAVLVRQLQRSLQHLRLANAQLLAETQVRLQAEESVRLLNTELESRVRLRTLQLEEANRELEAFSYAASHDLRAPLAALDGYSALLGHHIAADDRRARHYRPPSRAPARQMADLIDAMLVLSRASRASLQHGTVDLSEVAHDLIARYRESDPQREVEVEIEPGLRVAGDARLLRQVLDNLLGNAWKFTSRQRNPRIGFHSVVQPDGRTVYEVSDNGAGFDMAYANKLFQPFHRLHTQEEFAGTGIGLATVHRIITRHGGRVWAESAPGRGATFHFTLGKACA